MIAHPFALLFPGQGSQFVGMGRALAEDAPEARAVFDAVDGALDMPLFRLMQDGPEAELTLTENAQPALLAVSMAAMAVLAARHGITAADARYVAGHSLGEYSALAAAGALDLADAARLLRARGLAMQRAVPVGAGAMAALMGVDFATADAIAGEAAQGEVCEAANDNADGQVVISGAAGAVARAIDLAKTKGVRRAVLLPVSAPFHCAMMQPAAEAMQQALAGVTIERPAVPLIANVTAAPISDPADIRRLLVAQVTGAVRWRGSMQFIAEAGVALFGEIGAGRVLSGLLRRMTPPVDSLPVATPAEADAFAARLLAPPERLAV